MNFRKKKKLREVFFLTSVIKYLFLFRVDSVMLLEEGFEMVSSDASDKMLKEAYKTRWDRRKEPAFDKWSEFFLTTTQYI